MGKSTSTIGKVSELAEALPTVERVVVISSSGNDFDSSEWPASVRDKVVAWADFLDGGDADPVFTRVPFSHPQFVLYSSGTTGMPKSIAHGCGNTLLQHCKELILHGDLREGDKMLFYTYLPASAYRRVASFRERVRATPSSRRWRRGRPMLREPPTPSTRRHATPRRRHRSHNTQDLRLDDVELDGFLLICRGFHRLLRRLRRLSQARRALVPR